MSDTQDSGNVASDHKQTECIEDGCEYGVRYLEEVPNGYRLTCGDHAGEDAIDLAEFDFRPLYDETSAARKYRPEPMRPVEAAGARVLDWWAKEMGSMKTASLVLRDDDHEIVAESTLYRRPGIYGIVRVGDSSDYEAAQEYVGERAERPEWASLVHQDPPMDHHVEAIQCVDCGAENATVNKGMYPSSGDYDRVRHEGDCPNATEDDKVRAQEQELADEIWGRPGPSSMALSCIYDEIQELRELRREEEWGLLRDPIDERFSFIETALEERLGPRYPSCPACDGELEADHEGIVECTECRYPMEWDKDTIAEIEVEYAEQARRVWGWRGHAGRKPAEVDDG